MNNKKGVKYGDLTPILTYPGSNISSIFMSRGYIYASGYNGLDILHFEQ